MTGSIIPGNTKVTLGDNTHHFGICYIGTTNIYGSLYVSQFIAGNLKPSKDSTYNLGTADYQWNNLYVSNAYIDSTLQVNSSITSEELFPSSNDSFDIGSESMRWSTLYINTVNAEKASFADGEVKISDGGIYVNNGTVDTNDLVVEYSATIKDDCEVYGNITSRKAITALSTSDIRLKANIRSEDYAQRLLSLGAVVDYNYNELAYQVRGCNKSIRHTGLIYQQAVTAEIDNLCSMGDDGYGYVNLLSTDFLATMAGALQQTIREQLSIKLRITQLENEINKLKEMI
jgi:hypothetical protein